MTLLEKIMQSKSDTVCIGCEHLIWPKKDLPFCKAKDKIILAEFPPNKCESREDKEKV